RPGIHQSGRVLRLLANFYPLQFPDRDIIHYNVVIHPEDKEMPETAKRVYARDIVAAWKSMHAREKAVQNVVYDGLANLFSPTVLPDCCLAPCQVEVTSERGFTKRFSVTIERVAHVSMKELHRFINREIDVVPQIALTAIQVLMRHFPALNFLTFGGGGGSFFAPKSSKPLPDGLVVHDGWYQSVRPTYRSLLLNMDVSSTTFYPTGSLIDVVCAFFGARNITGIRPDWLRRDRNRLVLYLKGLKTKLTYENHTKRSDYKIAALTKDGARETVQEIDGKKISIANYYLTRHNIHLEFPTLPCAVMDKKGRVIIPMELLTVKPGQRHTGKLNDKQLADMIKVTAVRPDQRMRRIEEGRMALHGRNPMFRDWGFSLGDRLVEVQAHQMKAPMLTFGGDRSVPSDGTWKYGKDSKFAVPSAPLACWAVAVFDNTDVRDVQRFVGTLVRSLEAMGVKVPAQQPAIVPAGRMSAEQVLRKCQAAALATKAGPLGYCQLTLCVLNSRDKFIYKEVKAAAETVIAPGLMTQCCLSHHVLANKPAYVSNLILKINAKLFGVNVTMKLAQELPELNEPTMIMGADVTHPPPGVTGGMSLSALTCSVDAKYAQYRATYRRQPRARSEMIQHLGEMAVELFTLFRQMNPRFPPRKILFYRDGVSEGQFDEVAFEEIPQLKKALAAMGWMNTKLTFITVMKRHHARFFPVNRNDADRSGNVPAGTVIDTGVTHPSEFDFYLFSHPGLQGTSRPGHYHVLYDENAFSCEALHRITYRQCYLFARSTRAVGIVPAVYYADIMATRASCHAIGGIDDTSTVMSGMTERNSNQTFG
ncbi:hypothetical protein CXG81DRAFT_4267, partial [Caulochytrium protostelioides]